MSRSLLHGGGGPALPQGLVRPGLHHRLDRRLRPAALPAGGAQIRRFGKYTIPEFLGDRYDCHSVRLIAATVTVIIAITYSTAQFKGIGLICGWIFGMHYMGSVFFAAGVVCAYMLISGMSGVTRNQQIQYVVLISAFLIPLWILVKKAGGAGILPQLEYGKSFPDYAGSCSRRPALTGRADQAAAPLSSLGRGKLLPVHRAGLYPDGRDRPDCLTS